MWGRAVFFVFVLSALSIGAAGCGGRGVPDAQVPINIAFTTDVFSLDNGLRVVLHQESSASSAVIHVRYYVGGKDDPMGRAGMAHFFEHLMFRGSRHTQGKDFTQWLAELGGDGNATTDHDTTDYFEAVPVGALRRALWLESDRMAYPLDGLDEEGFENERRVVKNERRERYENVPFGSIGIVAHEEVFRGHPYAAPVIGYAAALDRITLDEVRAFGRRYYSPSNATLVVASPLPLASVRKMVDEWFSSIPPAAPIPSTRVPLAFVRVATAERPIELEADVEGPAVALAWPAPPVHTDGWLELRYAVGLVEGEIYRRLVTNRKVAYDADVDLEDGLLESMVLAMVKLKPRASMNEAIQEIDDALKEVARYGSDLFWEGFADYRTRVALTDLRHLETLEGRAERMLHDVDYHGATAAAQDDLRQLLRVPLVDVGGAVRQLLLDRRHVTIIVRPRPSAPPAGRRIAE
ncbi:MAG: insulinase family protein [Labilithrix sp.]|nr:insulinase family protein [Labilithrix sp.]